MRLAGMDALAGCVCHGDGAESGFQFFRKPKRHLARQRRDLVADAWFGTLEKCMRRCFTRREQKQQGDYWDNSWAAHGQFLETGLGDSAELPKIGFPIPRGSMASR